MWLSTFHFILYGFARSRDLDNLVLFDLIFSSIFQTRIMDAKKCENIAVCGKDEEIKLDNLRSG